MNKHILPVITLSADGNTAVLGNMREIQVINVNTRINEIHEINYGVRLMALSYSGKRLVVSDGSDVSLLTNEESISGALHMVNMQHLKIGSSGPGLAVASSDTRGTYMQQFWPEEGRAESPVILGDIDIYGVDLADNGSAALFWGCCEGKRLLRYVDMSDGIRVSLSEEDLSVYPVGGGISAETLMVYDEETILLLNKKEAGSVSPRKIDMGFRADIVSISPKGHWLAWMLSGESERRIKVHDVLKSKTYERSVLKEHLFCEAMAVNDEGHITWAGIRHPDELHISVDKEGVLHGPWMIKTETGVVKDRGV